MKSLTQFVREAFLAVFPEAGEVKLETVDHDEDTIVLGNTGLSIRRLGVPVRRSPPVQYVVEVEFSTPGNRDEPPGTDYKEISIENHIGAAVVSAAKAIIADRMEGTLESIGESRDHFVDTLLEREPNNTPEMLDRWHAMPTSQLQRIVEILKASPALTTTQAEKLSE